jgi:hypothetical protein
VPRESRGVVVLTAESGSRAQRHPPTTHRRAGKPTSKQIEEVADRWGFLTKALDVKVSPTAAGGAEI